MSHELQLTLLGKPRLVYGDQALRRFARLYPYAWPRAHHNWQRSLALAEQLAMPYEQGKAHEAIGRLLLAGGKTEQGREHLAAAQTIFVQIFENA